MRTIRKHRKHNNTKKRKHIGGSTRCIYDKSTEQLHITIPRSMLESNLNDIKGICKKTIKEYEGSQMKIFPLSNPISSSKDNSKIMVSNTARLNILRNIPMEEDLESDRGVFDGRRSQNESLSR